MNEKQLSKILLEKHNIEGSIKTYEKLTQSKNKSVSVQAYYMLAHLQGRLIELERILIMLKVKTLKY
jgi:hypothetical protein